MPNELMMLAAVCLMTLALPLSAAETPAGTAGRTLVIVHGAWGGSWSFRKVEGLLEAKGHKVHRVALTGLGERVHLATPETGLGVHIEDVVNHLEFEELTDVVLVGHSYGGMVITGVADRVPQRLRRLVYLDAFVPEDGESVMTIPFGVAGRKTWIDSITRNGFLVPPWVGTSQAAPKDVPQPLRTFTDPIILKNPAAKKIPGSYILTIDKGAKEDDFSPYAERAKARGYAVEEMETDHNPQWSAPEALVERLHRAATAP